MVKKKLRIVLVCCFLSCLQIGLAQDSIPSYIRTSGKLPQLAYSSGEDRLGSAKMGYIDTNIVLKVLDTLRNLYKVELSSGHYAFIEKNYTQSVADTILKTAISESWRKALIGPRFAASACDTFESALAGLAVRT